MYVTLVIKYDQRFLAHKIILAAVNSIFNPILVSDND